MINSTNSIEEVVAALNTRVSRLETGGKRNQLETAITEVQETIVAGGFHTFRFSVPWDDPNVNINPRGQFYWTAYLNSVHENNRWPIGENGNIEPLLFFGVFSYWHEKNSLEGNENESHFTLTVVNNDFTGSGTIIIRFRWLYVAGSTGVTAS